MKILENKTAVIYGAGGSLGSAVAVAFSEAGAKVFLTGRSRVSLEKTAALIISKGGSVDLEEVDAFDEKAIQDHLEKLVRTSGKVDISFNAVGIENKQNIPLVDMAADDFVDPVTQTITTQFLTAKATGRVMIKQGSGVILTLTATPGGIGYPYTGGFGIACAALESFSRNLGAELGVYGIRVVNIRSGGSPDSRVFKEAIADRPEIMQPIMKQLEADTMLKKLPLMQDIANTAVFLSSDLAGKITGVSIDVTSGTTAALNYRVPKFHNM